MSTPSCVSEQSQPSLRPSSPPVLTAVCRGLTEEQYPGSHVGVFPWFSFLNHSCCPNTSYMVLGDVMVVRAAADVAGGEPLSATYIGPRTMEPLVQRRAYLQVWTVWVKAWLCPPRLSLPLPSWPG